MSSGAVVNALLNDAQISAKVGDGVYPDYALDTVPRSGMFIILRWGSQYYRREARNGPLFLTVWVHQPEEQGSDYTEINRVLERCRAVLEGMEHVVGPDGVSVTSVSFTGHGGNLVDPGFRTVSRSSSYNVLLRMV